MYFYVMLFLIITITINKVKQEADAVVVKKGKNNTTSNVKTSVACATSIVQAALNRLVEWSSKWRLPLNPLKCETSFFSLDPYQSRIQPSVHS